MNSHRRTRPLLVVGAMALAALVLGANAAYSAGEVTHEVSVSSNGESANQSASSPKLSADGHLVAFYSNASNLVPGDTNGRSDGFVRDRVAGTTERVTVGPGGVQGNNDSYVTDMSPDGRFVAFQSWATNLVPGIPAFASEVYRLDRTTGDVSLASVMPDGTPAPGFNRGPSISADGRFVAFIAQARLVPEDPYGTNYEIYVRDVVAGTTQWVTHNTAGTQADGPPDDVVLSDDGRIVAFTSYAADLIAGDTNDTADVFVRDLTTDAVERVSVGAGGAEADFGSFQVDLSGDGRVVSFSSYATNLTVDSPSDGSHIESYVHDRTTGLTERVSKPDAAVADLAPLHRGRASISRDGRYVAFIAEDDITSDDTNGKADIIVRDRAAGRSFLGSRTSIGGQGDDVSSEPAISGDGRYVAFKSFASNMVPGHGPGEHPALYVRYLSELDTCGNRTSESGAVSRHVHGTVEPLAGPARPTIHAVNCGTVVPAGL